MLKGLLTRLFVLSLFLAAPSGAVDRAVSGLWYNPTQSGHGFEVTAISLSSVAITWYTYSPFATPIWVIGVLIETSPGVLTGAVDYYDGMRFGMLQQADLAAVSLGHFDHEPANRFLR